MSQVLSREFPLTPSRDEVKGLPEHISSLWGLQICQGLQPRGAPQTT